MMSAPGWRRGRGYGQARRLAQRTRDVLSAGEGKTNTEIVDGSNAPIARLDRARHVALVGDDPLRAQGDAHGLLGRKRQRLVVGVGMQRLRTWGNAAATSAGSSGHRSRAARAPRCA